MKYKILLILLLFIPFAYADNYTNTFIITAGSHNSENHSYYISLWPTGSFDDNKIGFFYIDVVANQTSAISSPVVPPPPPSGGGGGGGYTPPSEGVFYYNGTWYDVDFVEQLFNWVEEWNQTLNDLWKGKGGILEYNIKSKYDTVKIGNTAYFQNRIKNEDEESSVEIHCTNFIDYDRDGEFDIETEPYKSFNKEIEAGELIFYETRIRTKMGQGSGEFMVGGICEYMDKAIPPATSFTFLIVEDYSYIPYEDQLFLLFIAMCCVGVLIWVLIFVFAKRRVMYGAA